MDTGRDDYRKKVEAQINLWGAKLDVHKAKVEKATADARIELHKQGEELHKLQDAAKKHLDQFASSAEGAWNDVKANLEESWTKLSTTFETAWSRTKD